LNGHIRIGPFLESLKKKGFNSCIEGHLISYYSQTHSNFVYLGIDPLPPNVLIPSGNVQNELMIKCRPKALPSYGDVLLGSVSGNVSKGSRRTKERKIGDVIKKVSLWRQYYNGKLENGEVVRKSLEDAANEVKISKKSLDDYLLQLRNGRKYGFNFNEHKDDKIGILRAFN
jgi:hypothetical protein